jgi:protein-disulfide isomerase
VAGKSMTPFYIGLGVLALGGIAFMIQSATGGRQVPLTAETGATILPGPRGVVLGPDSAPVEIMEFSDFECPFCAQYALIQMPDIKARLLPTGKVRWRFVHYPLAMHAKGPYAHLAAACANDQGKFWEMHDIIYENQEEWSRGGNTTRLLSGYATRAGLDMTRYDACMDGRTAWARVVADKALGDSINPGMGTPTFFINGRPWAGNRNPTTDQLLVIVDSLSRTAAPAQGARRPATR